MGIIIPIILIIITSIIIWKSSDGFDVASSYLGRNLSNGVKGATINAISSSMPELLTTIFFFSKREKNKNPNNPSETAQIKANEKLPII